MLITTLLFLSPMVVDAGHIRAFGFKHLLQLPFGHVFVFDLELLHQLRERLHICERCVKLLHELLRRNVCEWLKLLLLPEWPVLPGKRRVLLSVPIRAVPALLWLVVLLLVSWGPVPVVLGSDVVQHVPIWVLLPERRGVLLHVPIWPLHAEHGLRVLPVELHRYVGRVLGWEHVQRVPIGEYLRLLRTS